MESFLLLLIAVIGGTVLMLRAIYRDHRQHRDQQRRRRAENENPLVAAVNVAGSNDSFLAAVRSRSCYAGLRAIHGVITCVGIAALAVLWIVLMNAADGTVDRFYTSVVCALIAAALFIEYGFFRMIVDAVDVLIDTSRRKAEGNA